MSQNLIPTTFCSTLTPKPNKIITYKGQDYSVDFNIIKLHCRYFFEHSSEFEDKEKIELNEAIDLPTDTIKTFLECSQGQPTSIYDIFGINYLSIKYQNDELKKFSQKFIETNYNQLIFQSLSFKHQLKQNFENQSTELEMSADTSDEERILATHLLEFIEDERIFSLSVEVIDRIFKKFLKENNEILNEQTTREKINKFLLKCLKQYKREGSVLFLNIKFDKLSRDLIVTLHNEFADVFDFNMINAKSLFGTTYDLIGEIAQIQSALKNITDQYVSQINAFNEYKTKIDAELNEIRSKQIEMNQNKSNSNQDQTQISSKIQSLERKNNDIENKITRFENYQNDSSGRIQSLENKQRITESQISQQISNQQSMQSSIDQISQKISKFATREISIKILSNFNHGFICNFIWLFFKVFFSFFL